jgi:hypothetical protein
MLCTKTWKVFCSALYLIGGNKGEADCFGAEQIEVSLPRSTPELATYYAFLSFFLPMPARPIRPVPRRIIVAGSGTGVVPTAILSTSNAN